MLFSDWHLETLSLTVESPERLVIEAVLDTLQAAPGSAAQDSLELPVRMRAQWTGDQLQLHADNSNLCTPATSILTADLRILTVRLPDTLTRNAVWSSADSTTTCHGGIAMSSLATHSYTVLGEAGGEFPGLIHVRRTSTINGRGEGAIERHRIRVSATGSETTDYYVEVQAARISAVQTDQQLDIQIENLGLTTSFRQLTRRKFSLAR